MNPTERNILAVLLSFFLMSFSCMAVFGLLWFLLHQFVLFGWPSPSDVHNLCLKSCWEAYQQRGIKNKTYADVISECERGCSKWTEYSACADGYRFGSYHFSESKSNSQSVENGSYDYCKDEKDAVVDRIFGKK